MRQYQRYNAVLGWLVFAISLTVYFLTVEPTVSWWDPGEHISTSYKLEVGHPPGAPTFGLTGRFLSLFAFGNTAKVALAINMISVLSSAFTILFLFWTITMLAKKLLIGKGEEMTTEAMWTILAAGFIGAMTFAFTDSFWFSAVEANVFAMSYFCTSVVIWAIFRWDEVADEKHHYRWLIFIGYMIGISIGVHLLNLLTIPALCLVFYFRKFRTTRWGIVLVLALSFILVALLMYYVIPWIPKLGSYFELGFVNGLGLPFNTGLIVYFILFLGLLVWGIWFTRKHSHVVLNTILLSLTFLLIGYTSFLTLVIRSNADTPINEDKPKDAISIVSYLNREQYGTWPILSGQYYSAPVINYEDGSPVYKKNLTSGKYVVIDDRKGTIPVYDPRFTTIFPRMWCTDDERPGASDFFKSWGGPGEPIQVTLPDGRSETLYRPTFAENLKFFFSYQVGWMYLRYFLWNFSGRQDDIQGFGGIKHANWVTGIPFLDKWHIGHSLSDRPPSITQRATHRYFLLPLLLGLAGFFFQLKRDYRNTIVIMVLFFMTGLAIVIYLNQKPFEPRERDYSYAASFMAFSIWAGMGVIAMMDLLRRKLRFRKFLPALLCSVLVSLVVPLILAQQNWKDHDRSGKYAARDFAANYLNSCDKNSILITNGDNDTFPLWYNQEVEGVRTDIRSVNRELASGAWYIEQLYKKFYESDPIPLSIPIEQYETGTYNIAVYYDTGIKGYVELKDLVSFLKSDNPETFVTTQGGQKLKFFPVKNIKITVNKENCLKYGIVPSYFRDRIADTIYFTINSNYLYKNDLMLLDLVASNDWTRPLYFATPSSVKNFFDVEPYCYLEGWVYKFMPVKPDTTNSFPSLGSIDPKGSHDILMNKCRFGNLDDPSVYIDPESLNNSLRPKMDFLFTCQLLIVNGKKKECKELLDLYFRKFPESKISYDMYNLPFIEMYYQAGDTASAVNIQGKLVNTLIQNFDYYLSFSSADRQAFSDEMQVTLETLQRLKIMASRSHQQKLEQQIESLLKQRGVGT